MPAPERLPLRVLVKGASTVSWLATMGGSRGDFAFPRVIESELLAAHWQSEVRAISIPSERTSATLRNWQREALSWSPDVVVLVYGHYESIHLFLPWWLEHHENSLAGRPGRIREYYRTRLLHPLWMMLARAQARADSTIDPTIRRSRPRRVAADLERLITHLLEIGSPLIYVFDLLPPARRYQSWFPGMAARISVMNDSLEAMVKQVDRSNVRMFRITDLVDKYCGGDIDVATPDGFHYSTYLHRMIGTELADDIAAWAATQDHLTPKPRADADGLRDEPDGSA